MPVENLVQPILIQVTENLAKVLFIIFAIGYFLFSLVVIRQVNLMAETVITEAAPILKALSILHAGLALGVIILFIGFL